MSKEQTLTAEEFYINNSTLSDIELIEQYAQVKVLEALEREVIKAYINGGVDDEIYFSGNDNFLKEDAVKYYETEVKPKYE